ncbi:MAG TPA: aminotransferase class I/II-fold pyridoxal phosphate-dependent enzyme, partial [Paracoccus sp.]|nr:aminotransferase class I/II-fold pyridoxal phosphate-dependent enzyme [Paracoccus sp. (in: a-proteobacteria)]
MRHSVRGQVDPFIVMDVMEAASRAEAEGRHIIHMEVGQPGTPAPQGARKALARALDQPLGYTGALGLPQLRQGIAGLYRRWYGVELDPARVVVTPGSSGAFILAFSALFDAGDRVAMGYPGYPSYRQILRAMSLEPVGIPTRSVDRYQPRPQELPRAEGLILASPGNPSGTVLRLDELQALTDAARGRGMAVISDEIYHGLSYGDRCHSALEVTDEVFVVNSFSKYFSMTGWRIGWMVVPDSHLRIVERLAQNLFICPP